MQSINRGFVPTDEQEFFTEKSTALLKRAQEDIFMLLERGYPIKSAAVFVGNHYLLSERQRMAIVRATAPSEALKKRLEKRVSGGLEGRTVLIDGFNLIISLEVALSSSTLISCMDGTVRDLAGLRGTYKLIDKTDTAIILFRDALLKRKAEKVIIYLDTPVSNSGRLKTRIAELWEGTPVLLDISLVPNADAVLQKESFVVTSDAIILNKCKSWINLFAEILKEQFPSRRCADLRGIEFFEGEGNV